MSASVSNTCPLPCSLRVSECSKMWFIKQKAWSDGLQRHQYNVKHETVWVVQTLEVISLISGGRCWVQFHTMLNMVSKSNVFKANVYTVVGHHTGKLKPELLVCN